MAGAAAMMMPTEHRQLHIVPMPPRHHSATAKVDEHESSTGSGFGGSALAIFLLCFEGCMIAIFVFKGNYADDAKPRKGRLVFHEGGDEIRHYYPMFQDVHVMIFIGFGFLMTFLKKYGYGAVGFNLLIAAIVVQWTMVVRCAVYEHFTEMNVGVIEMICGEFGAAVILISFGALLGKTNALQLSVMAVVEVVLYVLNEYIGTRIFKAADMGGSIFIHTFGAYFGLAAARMLDRKAQYGNPKEGSVYHSDLFSMIGTVFLWMFWPSFNAIMAPDDSQHRCVINTYLSIAASCITAFGASAFFNGGKLNMVHVQNATLAGGVAVGSCADMVLQPYGALAIGACAGILSTAGYQYLQPLLLDKIGLHDTCGVNNLHGMPGILAGISSIIVANIASFDQYGYSLFTIFPTRAGNETVVASGEHRSASQQAIMQTAALGTTLAMALVGGSITGIVLGFSMFGPPKADQLFDDTDFWEMPAEGVPVCPGDVPREGGGGSGGGAGAAATRTLSAISHKIRSAFGSKSHHHHHPPAAESHGRVVELRAAPLPQSLQMVQMAPPTPRPAPPPPVVAQLPAQYMSLPAAYVPAPQPLAILQPAPTPAPPPPQVAAVAVPVATTVIIPPTNPHAH